MKSEQLIYDSESDVEQKFIAPLITNQYPIGLGYTLNDYKTKLNLRKVRVDKGKKEIVYFPDYMIILEGLPLIIIEAKKPGEDLLEALREARLYANAINALYSNKINPCTKVIATDGIKILAAYSDDEKVAISVDASELTITNPNFYELLEFAKKDSAVEQLQDIQKLLRRDTKFLKPIQLLGGAAIQNSTVGENSFGSNLSIEYSFLFNPETEEEKKNIAKNAYVGSKTKLSHVNSIDRVIRSLVDMSDSKTIISDTEKPSEIINVISDQSRIKNKVLLLVGSVGAGKSTFVTYLREVALPEDLKSKMYWLTFNMNDAPDRDHIYEWILDGAMEKLSDDSALSDIHSLENLKKIFGKEISQFNKLAGSLLQEGSSEYNKELYNEIQKLKTNKPIFLKHAIKFLFTSRRISLFIALDNVDKKDKDIQLLMFEVANWLVSSFNCSVFLPLRDETYQNYKYSPPLDTVIKDFVFKIESPLLEQVIYKRFEYLLRTIGSDKRTFYYNVNNLRVECKRGEITNYISSILTSLFQSPFFKRLIIGLSGKDTRRGLEIFLDFCKSGHIPDDEILKMRFATDHTITNTVVARILLRGNRRYYSDNGTKVKNLFHSYQEDNIPDPFIRLSILRWLKDRFYIQGPNKMKGYHRLDRILNDLTTIGHPEKRVLSEIGNLIENSCIVTESQSINVNKEDLITITSTGFVHFY